MKIKNNTFLITFSQLKNRVHSANDEPNYYYYYYYIIILLNYKYMEADDCDNLKNGEFWGLRKLMLGRTVSLCFFFD